MHTEIKSRYNSLVTGGIQGIGKNICEELKKRGDNVFIFDILPLEHEKVIKAKKEGFYYFQVDVSSLDSIKKGFLDLFNIINTFPNKALNLLVNNAGITRDNLAIRLSESDWDAVLDVNLKGAFFCCQQAIKKMMRQKKSYIINISSIVGINGNIGQVNYSASKAGLIAITKTLAVEYGKRNVLINAIAPGFIQTDMANKLSKDIKNKILERITLKRFGTTQDVANLVSFLSGGKADYITGEVIELNGGLF
ncbi:SDR family oxidoreductase [Candidatus Dependentiae bacterium]|nr:SDR family oxidoreductase [Candidatus Dependentiae bacterium]